MPSADWLETSLQDYLLRQYSPALPERFLLTLYSHSDYVAHLDGFTVIPGGWLNGHYIQLAYQLADSVSGFTYSFGGTCIILSVMNLIPGLSLRASEHAEIHGIDDAEIGEFAVWPMFSILSGGPQTNPLSLLVWLCRARARLHPRRSKPSGPQSRESFPRPGQIRWCVEPPNRNLPQVLFLHISYLHIPNASAFYVLLRNDIPQCNRGQSV